MSEHTEPRSPQDLEFFYVAGMATAGTPPHVARAEFKATLDQVRREAKVEALRELAKGLDLDAIADEWSTTDSEHWAAGNAASAIQGAAFDRADQIEQEGKT